MTEKRVATFTATIYIAGDLTTARQVCREFYLSGLCVTLAAAPAADEGRA